MINNGHNGSDTIRRRLACRSRLGGLVLAVLVSHPTRAIAETITLKIDAPSLNRFAVCGAWDAPVGLCCSVTGGTPLSGVNVFAYGNLSGQSGPVQNVATVACGALGVFTCASSYPVGTTNYITTPVQVMGDTDTNIKFGLGCSGVPFECGAYTLVHATDQLQNYGLYGSSGEPANYSCGRGRGASEIGDAGILALRTFALPASTGSNTTSGGSWVGADIAVEVWSCPTLAFCNDGTDDCSRFGGATSCDPSACVAACGEDEQCIAACEAGVLCQIIDTWTVELESACALAVRGYVGDYGNTASGNPSCESLCGGGLVNVAVGVPEGIYYVVTRRIDSGDLILCSSTVMNLPDRAACPSPYRRYSQPSIWLHGPFIRSGSTTGSGGLPAEWDTAPPDSEVETLANFSNARQQELAEQTQEGFFDTELGSLVEPLLTTVLQGEVPPDATGYPNVMLANVVVPWESNDNRMPVWFDMRGLADYESSPWRAYGRVFLTALALILILIKALDMGLWALGVSAIGEAWYLFHPVPKSDITER